MKLAILGASGETGQQLLKQALDDGHDVIAIVRISSKISVVHDRLKIVVGNIFSDEDLKKHFQDVDAVMTTLGFPNDPKPVTGFMDATKSAIRAMREVNCKRIIILHSWYTQKQSRDDAPFSVKSVLIPMIAPVLDNMRETEEYLEAECGDIDYTVVLPPGLVNEAKTDADFEVVDNCFSIPGANNRISRADVARYMLKIIQDDSSYKSIQAIAVKT